MKHKQPIVTRASRPIPTQAWKRLGIGLLAFAAAATLAIQLIS